MKWVLKNLNGKKERGSQRQQESAIGGLGMVWEWVHGERSD